MRVRRIRLFFINFVLVGSLWGCATLVPSMDRAKMADRIAEEGNLAKKYFQTDISPILVYYRFGAAKKPLFVYIEGDGSAWKSKTILSEDPTPLNPVALVLASVDNHENIAYVARPGQYPTAGSKICNSAYWSERRFSPEVVEGLNAIIDQLKRESGVSYVELIGYSGGGALAVLLAAKREDVISIRTVAGNLDTEKSCEYQRVSPLTGSFNPADYAAIVKDIPQRHFIAERDKVIPSFIVESFVERIGDLGHESVTIVRQATHGSNWGKNWSALLKISLYRR